MKLLKSILSSISYFILFLIISSCSNSDDDVIVDKSPAAPQINLNTVWEKSKGIETVGIQKIYEYKEKLLAITIAKGVFISEDNGITWISSNVGIVDENNVQLEDIKTYDISGYGNALYLLTSGNIYLSKDSGSNWEPTNFDTEGFRAGGSKICAINETTICASSGSGKFIYNYSSNSGNSWTHKTLSFANYYHNYKVNNNNVYTTKGSQGIINSTDNGKNWNSIGLESIRCYDFLFKNDLMITSTEAGIFKKNTSNEWIEGNVKGLPGITSTRISTLIENNNWIVALTYDNEIFISKIIENKIADWQQLKLDGLEFIDDYMYISALSFSKEKLLIGTTDLHNVGKTSLTHGKGVYTANISF